MKIEVLHEDGSVHTFELESYVARSVTAEMPSTWHPEALKAQAVASRSYALYAMKHPRHKRAPLCSTVHCQAVASFSSEEAEAACRATTGLIATYEGEVIEAVYFARCPGRTKNSEEVWLEARPYLVSVECALKSDKPSGHGVGLCQSGAQAMALAGFSFKEILKHYYSGIDFEQIKGRIRGWKMLRIGLHSIRPNGAIPALREALTQGVLFPLMKCVDDLGPLLEVAELERLYGVEIIKIGRWTGRDVPPIELGMNDEELKRIAEDQMDWLCTKATPYRHLENLYLEPVNEPAWPELERHLALCKFFMHCMDIAERNNLKLALFSYSMGFPKIEWWPSLIETGVFARARAGGHILSLHEGTMGQDLFAEGVIPWLCHRYRFIYELLAEDEKIPLAITEFTFGDVEQYGKEKWVLDLVTYAKDLAPYVIGVTPFTLGPTVDWEGENYEACLPMIIEELVKAREEQPEEEPFFKYDSASILLPQEAGWEYWVALKKFIERYRPSILQSVHDAAAISPYARTHTVTAINPTEEFLEFLRKELNTD